VVSTDLSTFGSFGSAILGKNLLSCICFGIKSDEDDKIFFS
jgi:hypothetical protein